MAYRRRRSYGRRRARRVLRRRRVRPMRLGFRA